MQMSTGLPLVQTILNESTRIRQDLIKDIQKLTNRKLITYIANFNFPFSQISYPDILPMEDILRSIGTVDKLDLMINSPGGEANTAEKIILMCRAHCKSFRVIVPNAAKSAATMIALASDEIVMGYMSELGPIDPQIAIPQPNGQMAFVPAQSVIDGLNTIEEEIKKGRQAVIFMPMLGQLSPALVDMCNNAIAYSKEFARKYLKEYMLKLNPEKVDDVAKSLTNAKAWLSHGNVINAKDAASLGLKINEISKDDKLWNSVWELFVRSEHYLMSGRNMIKIFESENASLQQTAALMPMQQQANLP